MGSRKKPSKPTGSSGMVELPTDGSQPKFLPINYPTGKDAVEAQILACTLRSANAKGHRLYGLTADPIQNQEDDFDFTLVTAEGKQYLDLMEIAFLTDQGGSYEKAPPTYNQGVRTDRVLDAIRAKATKYGLPTVRPVHLLCYSTDWRFGLSDGSLRLLGYYLHTRGCEFASVVYYRPDDELSGEVTILYPIHPSEEDIASFDEAHYRNKRIHVLDLSKGEPSPDSRSITFEVPPPPGAS